MIIRLLLFTLFVIAYGLSIANNSAWQALFLPLVALSVIELNLYASFQKQRGNAR